jgi:hypothetical protein
MMANFVQRPQQSRKRSMTKIFAAALLLTVSGLGSATAMTPQQPIQSSDVIQVAGGCGQGWHRGPYGGCRRNFAPGTIHACPRGFHIGPGGHCRGNGR